MGCNRCAPREQRVLSHRRRGRIGPRVSPLYEVCFKVAGLLLALVGLRALTRGRSEFVQRHPRRLLWALTALGLLAWPNFGGFHTDGSKLHPWEQLHYVLGSKYFPELGYDGLYAALLTAREERTEWELPAQTRDLRTMRVEPTHALSAHRAEVRARFTDARWEEFARDATAIWIRDEFFLDHGYFPTPAHTAVSRLFSSHLHFGQTAMRTLALVDVALLGLMGWAVYAWVSLETLAAMSLMFGLGFCTRYYWVGGAFLRQDWFVALVVCGAALHARRFLLAGALLGYASMVRVFPAAFVLPLFVHLVAARRRGEAELSPGRFAIGCSATAALLFVAGCLQGHGVDAWVRSADRLASVARSTFPNAIGLRVPFVTSLSNFKGELVHPDSLYLLERISADYAQLLHERFWLLTLSAFLVVAAFLSVAWRTRAVEVAFASGVGVVYALATATCYYGSYFVLLAYREPLRTANVFLLGQLATYGVVALVFWLSSKGLLVFNGAAIFAPTAALLGVVLALWWRRAWTPAPQKA